MSIAVSTFGYLVIAFLVFGILGTFAWGGISAAPWVPLWKSDVRRMLRLAKVQPGEFVYDLGAGDGRIIMMAASEFKAQAIGFEIAILPYLIGYIKIKLMRLGKLARLKYSNFYTADLSQADVITIFLTPSAMKKLKEKLLNEIKPTCRVVSYAFSIPDWQPAITDKPQSDMTTIYVYQKNGNKK